MLYFVRDEMAKDPEFMEKNKEDICASFQKTLIDILMDKLIKAAGQTVAAGHHNAADGVAGKVLLDLHGIGTALRGEGQGFVNGGQLALGEPNIDHRPGDLGGYAAMIAIAGWFHYLAGERTPLDIAPVSRIADY